MELNAIPSDIQTLLATQGEKITLQTGDVLCQQGDPSEAVYFVNSGKLAVYAKGKREQNSTLLNYIMPGEIAGEIGALTGWPRTATLTAERPTIVYRVSQEEVEQLLRKNPSLAKFVIQATSSHLVYADVERVNLGRSYQQMRLRVSTLGEEKYQLEELLRLREEMEYMLVHDLRNPLNTIKTGMRLLKAMLDPNQERREEQETVDTIIDVMETATRRMIHLTDTLLDIAKMEAGKTHLLFSNFNLVAIVYALVNELRPQATEHSVKLIYNSPLEIPIEADRDVISRVIVNLIDNALKFAPPHSQVTIAVSSTSPDWAEVSVTDEGPGVPEAERERIFEKFTQIENANPAHCQGLGLGLTFCRMAVEAHGGTIQVEPGPNNTGAHFTFKLPRQHLPDSLIR